MKLSDYVVHYLADLGIKHVFVVTGGYAVNLIDSFHHEPRMSHICVNHEQVAAMAGEGYARMAGLSAVITTNAPGALNLLNGIDGCWNDSIPCIFICGQVPRKVWDRSKQTPQDREIVDIVTIVKSITKSADYVEDPNKIKYYLDKAVHIAQTGRPGPVLLDIPLDIQKTDIEPNQLISFAPPIKIDYLCEENDLEMRIGHALHLLENAQRPVVLLGGGVRLSNTMDQAIELIEKLGIPTVITWCASDILPANYTYLLGSIGTYGNRRANYTIQNSDLVLALGARLSSRQTGGDEETFARAAKKIMVTLDHTAVKNANTKIDLPIVCDLRKFFKSLLCRPLPRLNIDWWREKTRYWKHNFSEILPEYYLQKDSVNVYVFMKKLSELVLAEVPVVTDCGGNLIWTMQAYQVKEGQRVFSNMGLSSMGYALAASIGVCLANDKKPVVCIIGDGGLQVHIQELQTIKYHNLPIKIFVVNNNSYGIIKQTIESWFDIKSQEELDKRCLAVSEQNGYSCPDFVRIANVYGISARRIKNHQEMVTEIEYALSKDGPVLCNVELDENQRIAPRLEFGQPLEDQHPLIDRAELKKIMLIDSINMAKEEKDREGI